VWNISIQGNKLKVALICPKYINKNECWGESIELLQFQSSLKRMGYKAYLYDLFNCNNIKFKYYDILITNCNNENLDRFVKEIVKENVLHKIFWIVSSPINMKRFWDENYQYHYDAYLTIEPNSDLPNSYHVECATDTETFRPDFSGDYGCKYLYVGNYDKRKYEIVSEHFRGKNGIHVYGNGWNDFVRDNIRIMGRYIPYEDTRKVYTQAGQIFALHNEDMVKRKMIQGRVYDILACGHSKEDIITNQDISRVNTEELDYKYRVEQILDIIDKREWRR